MLVSDRVGFTGEDCSELLKLTLDFAFFSEVSYLVTLILLVVGCVGGTVFFYLIYDLSVLKKCFSRGGRKKKRKICCCF